MNHTKIDWCDMTFNPVTGCYHNCAYCYARRIAERFGGFDVDSKDSCFEPGGSLLLLDSPLYKIDKSGKERIAPFPNFFEPTFHRYRLDEPQRRKSPRTIFVGSMCDLFGDWVPLRWIRDVFDACLAAPWHKYLCLTKNPRRYGELAFIALLPHEENFWYGSTATNDDGAGFYSREHKIHTFLSLEPLHGPINLTGGCPDWVIIGAETGNRKGKIVPERAWIDGIAAQCAEMNIPIFYKESVRKLFPDLPQSQFPW